MKINPYIKYKKILFPFPIEIPEHWGLKKMRFIGKFYTSGIDKKIIEGEPFVKMINYTDIYGNKSLILDSKREYMIVTCSENKKQTCQIKKGELIFTPSSETIEDIGLSALVDENIEETVFSYHVLRFVFKEDINHNFKKYLCNNSYVLNYYSKNALGTTRQILDRNDFNSTIVFVPPLSEQKAIADFLDYKTAQIDELIEQKEKLLELLEEKQVALITRAVTKGLNPDVKMKSSGIDWLEDIPEHWETIKLKYISKIQFSGVDKKSSETENEIRLCNYIDVYKNDFINKNIDFMIATATEKEIKKFIIENGDVIVTKDSETPDDIAVPALVVDKFEDVICGYHLAQIKPNKDILTPEYLFRLFQAKNFNSYFAKSANGITRFGLGTDVFGSAYIPITNLKEQAEIANYIKINCEKINILKENIISAIEKLKEYRSALITAAVTGKIDVRNFNTENKNET